MVALAASLAFGTSMVAPQASADDMMMSSHEPMPGVVDIVRAPTDLPPAIGSREPQHVTIDLETVEVTGQLNDGTSYHSWTFNGRVPGPFVRVSVSDIIEVHLKNALGLASNGAGSE